MRHAYRNGMLVSRQVGPTGDRTDPRASQRNRTRSAVLTAARTLVERGQIPTIPDVATAADVSRATAYRYFPTQAALVATLVEDAARSAEELELAGTEPRERLDEGVREAYRIIDENEPAMRAALRLGLQQAAAMAIGEEVDEPIRRGGRMAVIEKALAPVRDEVEPEVYERLRAGVSLLMGIESRVVLGEIAGLKEKQQLEVCRWAAAALLEAALAEGRKT